VGPDGQVEHEPAIVLLPQRRGAVSQAALGKVLPGSQGVVILPLCSVMLRPHPKCWVLSRAPQHKRDMELLESVQQRATKMIKGLSQTPKMVKCTSPARKVRESWDFSLEKAHGGSHQYIETSEWKIQRGQSQALFSGAQ